MWTRWLSVFLCIGEPLFFSEGKWNKKGKEITWKLDIFKSALCAALAIR
jgi:hypothetical protein